MILDTEKITQLGKVLLVAREQELGDQVETILPWTQVAREESLLAALLRMPKENFDLVLVRVPRLAGEMDSALRSFRRVAVAVKIILLTDIFEERISVETAKTKIQQWMIAVAQSGLRCFDRFLNTLGCWWNEILNYFVARETSGFVEGFNNKIKVLKRRCYGITSVAHLFQRIYLDLEGYRLFA